MADDDPYDRPEDLYADFDPSEFKADEPTQAAAPAPEPARFDPSQWREEAAPAAAAPPRFDPKQWKAEAPQAEGAIGTFVREALHGAPASVAAGATTALTAGGAASLGLGPVGGLVVGIPAGIGAAYMTDAAVDKLSKAAGFDDDAIRTANQEQHPWAAAGGRAISAAAAGTAGAVSRGVRIASGLLGGGVAAASEAYQQGKDIATWEGLKRAFPEVAAQTVGGAVFARPYNYQNRLQAAGERAGARVYDRLHPPPPIHQEAGVGPEMPPGYQGERPAWVNQEQYGGGLEPPPHDLDLRFHGEGIEFAQPLPEPRPPFPDLRDYGGGPNEPLIDIGRHGETPGGEPARTGYHDVGDIDEPVQWPSIRDLDISDYGNTAATSRPAMPDAAGNAKAMPPPPKGGERPNAARYAKQAQPVEPGRGGVNVLQPGQADPAIEAAMRDQGVPPRAPGEPPRQATPEQLRAAEQRAFPEQGGIPERPGRIPEQAQPAAGAQPAAPPAAVVPQTPANLRKSPQIAPGAGFAPEARPTAGAVPDTIPASRRRGDFYVEPNQTGGFTLKRNGAPDQQFPNLGQALIAMNRNAKAAGVPEDAPQPAAKPAVAAAPQERKGVTPGPGITPEQKQTAPAPVADKVGKVEVGKGRKRPETKKGGEFAGAPIPVQRAGKKGLAGADDAATKASIEKGQKEFPKEPTPGMHETAREVLDLANQIEATGHPDAVPFVHGMRSAAHTGAVKPGQNLDFYRAKLAEFRAKTDAAAPKPKEEVSVERWLDPPQLKSYKEALSRGGEIKALLERANARIKELAKQVNDLGYKVNEESPATPKEVKALNDELTGIAAHVYRLVSQLPVRKGRDVAQALRENSAHLRKALGEEVAVEKPVAVAQKSEKPVAVSQKAPEGPAATREAVAAVKREIETGKSHFGEPLNAEQIESRVKLELPMLEARLAAEERDAAAKRGEIAPSGGREIPPESKPPGTKVEPAPKTAPKAAESPKSPMAMANEYAEKSRAERDARVKQPFTVTPETPRADIVQRLGDLRDAKPQGWEKEYKRLQAALRKRDQAERAPKALPPDEIAAKLKAAEGDNAQFDKLVEQLRTSKAHDADAVRAVANAYLGRELSRSKYPSRDKIIGQIADWQRVGARQAARGREITGEPPPTKKEQAAQNRQRQDETFARTSKEQATPRNRLAETDPARIDALFENSHFKNQIHPSQREAYNEGARDAFQDRPSTEPSNKSHKGIYDRGYSDARREMARIERGAPPHGPLAGEVAPQHILAYERGLKGEPFGSGNDAEKAAWDRGGNDRMTAERAQLAAVQDAMVAAEQKRLAKKGKPPLELGKTPEKTGLQLFDFPATRTEAKAVKAAAEKAAAAKPELEEGIPDFLKVANREEPKTPKEAIEQRKPGETVEDALKNLLKDEKGGGRLPIRLRREGAEPTGRRRLREGRKSIIGSEERAARVQKTILEKGERLVKEGVPEGTPQPPIRQPARIMKTGDSDADTVLARIAEPGRLWDRIPKSISQAKEAAHYIYEQLVNEQHPYTRLKADVEGLLSRPLTTDEDFEMMARTTRGLGGRFESILNEGPYNPNTGQVIGPALRPILDKISASAQDRAEFTSYAAAKHAIERESYGHATGIPLPEANRTVAKYGAKWGQTHQELMNFEKGMIRMARDLVGDEGIRLMEAKYNSHVPFYRAMDPASELGDRLRTGGGMLVKDPVYKVKEGGSERLILDPIQSIIKNAIMFTDLAEKNKTQLALKGVNDQLPAGTEFLKRTAPNVPITVSAAERARLIAEGIPAELVDKMAQLQQAAFKPGEGKIAMYENGVRMIFEAPKDIVRVSSGMHRDAMPLWGKVLGAPAAWLRAGSVLNPDFTLKNFSRDQVDAFIQSKHGYLPVIDFVSGLKEIFNKQNSAIYQHMLRNGMFNASLVSMDKDLMKVDPKTLVGKVANVVTNPSEFMHMLRVLSETVENATRLGEAKRAVAAGVPLPKAALGGREVTVDFPRMGASNAIRWANQLIPFFNASVQGTDRIARALFTGTKQERMTVAAKILGAITLPSIGLWFNNKDDVRYQEMPMWEKNLFWIIPTDKWVTATGITPDKFKKLDPQLKRQLPDGTWQYNAGTMWHIPKPFGPGVLFGSVPERMFDYFYANNPKAFKNLSKTAIDAFTPGWMPQALSPVVEGTFNWSQFREHPLMPEQVAKRPQSQQVLENTSETAIKLASAFRGVLGDRPSLNLGSPIVIDNYIQQWTGGLGRYAVNLGLDPAIKTIEGKKEPPPAPTKTWGETPLVKAFASRFPTIGTESVDNFYKERDIRREQKAGVDALKKTDPKAYGERVRQGGIDPGNIFAKQLQQQRDALKQIKNSEKLSPDEKRIAMDIGYFSMIDTARKGLEFFEKTKRKELQ